MGIYGNITNVNRTQFSFDKIYSNRKAMDQSRMTDGIYLGRYVLVEYDNDGLDGMKQVYINSKNEFFTTESYAANSRLNQNNTEENEVVYSINNGKYYFYKCISKFNPSNTSAAVFKQITNSSETSYTRNFNIDRTTYDTERGFDSTVWQKVYNNNKEQYVMIAELNTVVPTFDIATDAPTMVPVQPHFDTQSTDVYYKLHLQNPWIVRVAEAKGNQSDANIEWQTVRYNAENPVGDQYDIVTETKKGAIYFNKAAFDPQIGETNIAKTANGENKIVIDLVSSNLALYDDHNNTTATPVTAKDIQELTINLPAIGNMMSDAWDIIHGPNRDDARTDENGSLQGRLNSFTDMNVNAIPVKRSSDGTLVGSYINGNQNKTVSNILNEDLSTSFESDDAWIQTSINTIGLDNKDDLSGIAIHHTFHSVSDTTSTSNKNGNGDTITLYTPKVDAAGHVVGKNTETVTLPYGFKTIKTNGRSTEESENATGTPTKTDIVADNTQDALTINSGNKWVRIDTNAANDTITIQHDVHNFNDDKADGASLSNESSEEVTFDTVTYDFDKAGHFTGKTIKTLIMPFGYGKIKGDNSTSTAATATYDELTFASDEWLTAKIEKDKVTYSHDYPKKKDDSTSTFDVNGNADTIVLETLERDDKGHVIKVNQNTVTLPYGYKTISIGDESNAKDGVAAAPGNVVADNTQDTLTINPGNKWIHLSADTAADSVTISHEVNTIETAEKAKTDLNNEIDTITIQDIVFDNAGHATHNQSHTYTLPYGFKTIAVGVASNEEINISAVSGSAVADNTQDILTINPGNRWINIGVNDTNINDTITLSHEVNIIDTAANNSTNLNTETNAQDEDNINIPDWTYDNAGHITSKKDHKYTLPFGYKTFSGDSGTTSANNTQDSMSVTGDKWVQTTVSNDKIAIAHIGPVSGTNTTATTPTPKFGETFSFNTYDFDDKGHKYNTTAHTVRIPSITLTDAEANNADVITQLTFTNGTDSTLVSTRSNIGNLKMTGYEKPTSISAEALRASETLNTALGKLEYRLEKEVDDRTNVINDLNYSENVDNAQIITQISQTNGKITGVSRAAAGTLVLGDGYSKAATAENLTATDSLNTAFGKIEKSLEDTNTRITNLIGGDNLNTAFDTLKEVSDWLVANDSGADKVIDDIAVLKSNNTVEGSIAYSIKQAIDNLDIVDTPVDGQYVSGVSEIDGLISVSRTPLPTYTLTSGSTNGTIAFNEADVAITGLKSAAYREEVYFVSKTQYDLDMSTKNAQINGLNTEAKRLTNEVNSLRDLVQSLLERVEELENPNNSTE